MASGELKKRNIDNRLTDIETGVINERNISYRVLRQKWGEDSNLGISSSMGSSFSRPRGVRSIPFFIRTND